MSPRVDRTKVVAELHEALTERLAAMTTSDDWLKYLSTSRMFHRYSPQNQMLLAIQGAEGYVAGYRNWQRIPAQGGGTCQVAKGQTGLYVLAPLRRRATEIDDITGDEVTKHFLSGFKPVKVFHQGQLVAPPDIDPDALRPGLLTGPNRWQHVWSAVSDHLRADGFHVALHSRTPVETWNGRTDYSDRSVLVADDLEAPQQLKTLLHEWAHVHLDHEHRLDLPRPLREVEAESVAYLLGESIGLDSQVYSVPYIAGWSGGSVEVVQSTAHQVLATTGRLVDTLERELGVTLAVDVIDRALPESDTNVIALPDATPPDPNVTIPDPSPPTDIALPGLDVSPIERADSSDSEFLQALGAELEDDQAAAFVTHIYRPDQAPKAAAILAESGRTATQTARILSRFGIGTERIDDALRAPVFDKVEGTTNPLYSPAEADVAIATISPAVDPRSVVSVESLRDEKIQDMKMLQRVVRTCRDPRVVAELARTLEIEPGNVVRVCEHSDTDPNLTVAIAVAVHGGDGAAAMHTLREVWPQVPGGWESYAHPSMLPATAHLSVVPDAGDPPPKKQGIFAWQRDDTSPEPESGVADPGGRPQGIFAWQRGDTSPDLAVDPDPSPMSP